ncbi:hypothetical protein [Bradyrhizobium sp.]|uniref:hypothetical protein n=1 Tax=Bradyrhizobium sp. TaxID=376 RepID=UPI0040381F79
MESDKVIIHLRFAPNGTVVEIGERPAGLSPQQWFDRLSDKYGNAYQVFSGGRGVFRLTRAEVDVFKAEVTPSAA